MNDLTQQDWIEWLQLPATHAFLAHAQAEWGVGGQRFERTMDAFADSLEADHRVLEQIRQVAVCRREILRLMKWPEEEAQRLKRMAQDGDTHARPALEPALSGQSRRGSL